MAGRVNRSSSEGLGEAALMASSAVGEATDGAENTTRWGKGSGLGREPCPAEGASVELWTGVATGRGGAGLFGPRSTIRSTCELLLRATVLAGRAAEPATAGLLDAPDWKGICGEKRSCLNGEPAAESKPYALDLDRDREVNRSVNGYRRGRHPRVAGDDQLVYVAPNEESCLRGSCLRRSGQVVGRRRLIWRDGLASSRLRLERSDTSCWRLGLFEGPKREVAAVDLMGRANSADGVDWLARDGMGVPKVGDCESASRWTPDAGTVPSPGLASCELRGGGPEGAG